MDENCDEIPLGILEPKSQLVIVLVRMWRNQNSPTIMVKKESLYLPWKTDSSSND